MTATLEQKETSKIATIRTGWWNPKLGHHYKRHSVERDVQLTGFPGWKTFTDALNQAKHDRNRKLVLTTFKCGGRINEMLDTKHENFKIMTSPEDGREYLLCEALPLSKRWKSLGKQIVEGKTRYITEKVVAFRTFALPLEDNIEPFSQEFKEFALSEPSGLLFPSPYKALKGKPLTTTRAYQIVRYEIGVPLKLELYNHLLRAWRASQLRHERHYGAPDLMEFFMWRDYKTALIYAKEGVWGLAGKGLPNINK